MGNVPKILEGGGITPNVLEGNKYVVFHSEILYL